MNEIKDFSHMFIHLSPYSVPKSMLQNHPTRKTELFDKGHSHNRSSHTKANKRLSKFWIPEVTQSFVWLSQIKNARLLSFLITGNYKSAEAQSDN